MSHLSTAAGIGVSPANHRLTVRSSLRRISTAKRRADRPDAAMAVLSKSTGSVTYSATRQTAASATPTVLPTGGVKRNRQLPKSQRSCSIMLYPYSLQSRTSFHRHVFFRVSEARCRPRSSIAISSSMRTSQPPQPLLRDSRGSPGATPTQTLPLVRRLGSHPASGRLRGVGLRSFAAPFRAGLNCPDPSKLGHMPYVVKGQYKLVNQLFLGRAA